MLQVWKPQVSLFRNSVKKFAQFPLTSMNVDKTTDGKNVGKKGQIYKNIYDQQNF